MLMELIVGNVETLWFEFLGDPEQTGSSLGLL